MSFPVTIGDKTFTTEDFVGRNYVYGYPAMLQAFTERGAHSVEWMNFRVTQRIVPGYGAINLSLPLDFEVGAGQLLLYDSGKGWLVIQVEPFSAEGVVLGQVVYLSDDFRYPQSEWTVGLATANTQTGFLVEPLKKSLNFRNRRIEAYSGKTPQGQHIYGAIQGLGYGTVSHASAISNARMDNIGSEGFTLVNALYTVNLWTLRDSLLSKDFTIRWILEMGGEWQIFVEGGFVIEAYSNNLRLNGVIKQSFNTSGTAYQPVKFSYNSSTNQLTLEHGLIHTSVPSTSPNFYITVAGGNNPGYFSAYNREVVYGP